MPGESVIYYIGAATSAVLALIVLGVVGGVILGLLAYRANIFIFPRLTFFLLEKLRSILKVLFSFFTRDRFLVERMAVKILNRVYHKRYTAVPPQERMVVLPQCLRDLECPAPVDPRTGIACKRCGRCVIDKIHKLDGTAKIYITPGGTFAARIVESNLPPAVLGVACPRDLYEGMGVCHSHRIPVQGVPLLRDGCVSTEVDFDEVAKLLLLREGAENAAAAQPLK
jgi:hypothetical protein